MEQCRSEVIFISVSKASLGLTPSDTAWKVSVSIHQRNINTLATEIYKAKNKIPPEIVNSVFEFTNKNYNLRNVSILKRKRYFTVHYGSQSLSSLAPKIWWLVPDSVREEIAWTNTKCRRRLCKKYIGQVWFI